MKKVLIGLVTAVVISIAAVLALPLLIDWNNYRDEIAQRVADATGQEIRIDGTVGLRLLPAPALTLSGFHIRAPGRPEAAELVALKRLDVRVGLLPLLRGHVQVENVILVEPRVTVAVDSRGAVNWQSNPFTAPPEGRLLAPDQATAGRLIAKAMSFDQVVVENGRFDYRDDRVGTVESVDKIDLRVVAGSLTGPFQVSGGITWRGTGLLLEAATGRFLESTAVPVRATLSRPRTDPDRPPTLRFAGIVGRTAAGAPRLQGDIRAEGADLRAALAIPPAEGLSGTESDPLAKPFSMRANLEANPDRLKVDGADVVLGDSHASGAGSLAATASGGDLQVTASVSNLNLDPWLGSRRLIGAGKAAASSPPAPTSPPTPTSPSSATAPLPVPPALAGLPGQGFVLPAGLQGHLDLAADGVTWRDGAISQGRLEANLKDGVLALDRVSVRLPGNSGLSAVGDLAVVGGVPRLTMLAQVQAEDLRALLGWLKVDTDGVRDDRLRAGAVSARLVAKPDRVDLTDVSLTVDDSHATAAVAAELRQRPALGVRVDVDKLVIDDYWPTAWNKLLRSGGKGTAKPLDRLAAREASLAQWLSGADVTLLAHAPQLTVGGIAARDVTIDATVAGGGVDVREASAADIDGLRVRLSGQAGSLAPLANAHFTISAETDSLERAMAGVVWPDYLPPPARLGRVTLEARLAGDLERTAVEGRAGIAGASLQVGGTVNRLPVLLSGGGSGADMDVIARVQHGDAVAALALLGLASPSSPGPLDLYARVGGDLRHLAMSDIRGTLGGTAVAGTLRLDRDGPRPAASGDLQLGALDLGRWLGSGAGGGAEAGAGAATVTATATGAPAFADTTSAPVTGNRLSGLNRMDGRLTLTVDQVSIAGATVEQAAAVGRLSDGVLQVDRFDGMLAGGRIGGKASLSAGSEVRPTGFTLALTGQGLMPDGETVRLGRLNVLRGNADVELSLRAAGQTTADWPSTLQGEGRIAVRDGVVGGVDLAALQRHLDKAEGVPAILEGIARGLQGGQTAFASLDGSCTIRDGVAATDNVRFESADGTLALSGRADLVRRLVDVTLTLDPLLTPPLPIVMSERGDWQAPVHAVDMAALQRVLASRVESGKVNEKN